MFIDSLIANVGRTVFREVGQDTTDFLGGGGEVASSFSVISKVGDVV